MSRYYYDLHTHSALSPCADNNNTPANLAGIAALSELQIMALTDHNSCKNCPAFFRAAEAYGVIPIAGMELTTAEDIHAVCLFPTLDAAMAFDSEVQKHRALIKNRTDIFGDQLIMDEDDNVLCREEHLLPNATDITLDEAVPLVRSFGGVCYPAHIDRSSNGIISILGTIPPTPHFTCFEIRDRSAADELCQRHSLDRRRIVISSDAHYLTDIKERENYFDLDPTDHSREAVTLALFRYLGGDV